MLPDDAVNAYGTPEAHGADRPVPAARGIPEEVEAVAIAIHEEPDFVSWRDYDRAEAAIEALRPHLARLLVGALGGEEAVVERIAHAMGAHNRNGTPYVGTFNIEDWMAYAEVVFRSLMEDTPDG